jgi:hypothetical protein
MRSMCPVHSPGKHVEDTMFVAALIWWSEI